MSDVAKQKESASLLRKLDKKSGNGDGKISYAEFEGYFNEKIAQIKKFEERVKARETAAKATEETAAAPV
jgi:hypothetical protein